MMKRNQPAWAVYKVSGRSGGTRIQSLFGYLAEVMQVSAFFVVTILSLSRFSSSAKTMPNFSIFPMYKMIAFQWFVMFLPNYSDLLLMKELVQFSRKLQFNNLMVWLWKEGGKTLLQKFDRCHLFRMVRLLIYLPLTFVF